MVSFGWKAGANTQGRRLAPLQSPALPQHFPQWTAAPPIHRGVCQVEPETKDSAKPDTDRVFSDTRMLARQLNLQIRPRKRRTKLTNKTELQQYTAVRVWWLCSLSDNWSENRDGGYVRPPQETARTHRTKGWLPSWATWGGTASDFTTLLRKACNLKCVSCSFR